MWGVLRFPRSVSNGAGARGASECSTCSHVLQLQRAPATRAPQRSNICQNPSRTLALERKRRTGTVGTSNSSNSYKLGNYAPHTNCAPQSHARPFRFVARLFDVLRKISHRGHTFGGHTVLLRVSCTRHSRGQGIMSDRHQNGTTRSALHYGYTRSRRPCSALIARY